jgi:hypothetical protein
MYSQMVQWMAAVEIIRRPYITVLVNNKAVNCP